MTIEEPTVLAHPMDLPRAAKYAIDHQLPLQLSALVPRGQMIVVDPTRFPFLADRSAQ